MKLLRVPRRPIGAILCLAAALVSGCVSVSSIGGGRPDYTTLPEDAMYDLALEIERAIAGGERIPSLGESAGLDASGEEVMQAIRTRAARIELIQEIRATGYCWEKRDGLLYLRSSREYKQSTNRRERARHALLIMSENDNRWQIYEGIRKDSSLRPKALDAIQALFFRARLETLQDGALYESENGDPVMK